eukprot:CAMPEP_0171262634 /NCGR_PEP_ID=MMETSP0790-20130122/56665_1 /TAXON_ID=2925 /ORGANISM="Alexandrium catenella, Strain OF101" /LENGTH=33 /DNA_ID= /DNA_START= /DNA_END= /DNA_ORIENTATION=
MSGAGPPVLSSWTWAMDEAELLIRWRAAVAMSV